MTEADRSSNRSEPTMTIFLLFVPIVIVAGLFMMRHDALRSALRQSGATSHLLPAPSDDVDADDLE